MLLSKVMVLSGFEKIILVLGVVIRLVLAPITFHSDVWANTIIGYFFTYEGVFNIYEYLRNLPADHPLFSGFGVNDIFVYLPLSYFTFGILMKVFQPLQNKELIETAMADPGNASVSSSIFTHSFLAKFPYLIFDLGIAFLLRSLFSDPKKKKLVFILWMLNPVAIYATFMQGQTSDIPQVFFIVLALVLAYKNRNSLSLAALGIAASFKMFPLFLIPIAGFILGRKSLDKFKFLTVGLVTFLLTILPFLPSGAFREIVFGSAASQKLFFMKLPLTGAEGIYIFIFIYALILVYAWFGNFAKNSLWVAFLFVFLAFFSVSHYHPQWFLWLTPFLALLLVLKNKLTPLVIMLFSLYVFLLFFFESSLTWGLFGPINHALYSAPSLIDVLPKFIDVNMVKSIARSLFAGVAFYLALRMIKEKYNEV